MNQKLRLLSIHAFMLILSISSCSFLPAQTDPSTPTKFIPTLPPTFPPLPSSTFTPAPPAVTATIPPIIVNTATPTNIPSTVSITFEDTKKGRYLKISRSTDGLAYQLGPLAKGVYKVGPTDDFLVYCTIDGSVYAAKLGDPYLQLIGRTRLFTAINRGTAPSLELRIFLNNGFYKVDVQERSFNQNEIFVIPGSIAR